MNTDTYVHRGGPDATDATDATDAADAVDTIVMVHGAGMDHTTWRFQSRWLAGRGYRVVAPDLPGHGSSRGPALTSVEEGAVWLAGLLAAESPNPVALVGHSLGALMTIELAADHPELVDSVVLVACSPRMEVSPHLMQAAENDLPLAADLMAGWMLPAAFEGGHPEPGTWEQGAIRRLIGRSGAGVLATDLKASAAYDATDSAGRLVTPALIVGGSDDRMVGKGGTRDLAGLIPGAEIVVLAGAGHEPMIQVPRRFNAALEAFVSSRGKASVR